MKTFKLFLLNTIMLFIAYVGNAQTISQYIFGGQPADISNFPYQVSLEIEGSPCPGLHACGGSILNERWILTAAHCTDGIGPGQITVHAGATNQTQNNIGQRIVVDQIIRHSGWTGDFANVGNDIALLHLSTPLCFNNNVQPINIDLPSLPSYIINPGVNATISGWGRSFTGGPCEANLRSAVVPIISNATAGPLFSNCGGTINIPNNMISFFNGASGSGGGDSGGPAVIQYNGAPLLIGVTSWGCNSLGNFPSIYTRVRSFSDFILNNVNFDQCSSSCNFPDIYLSNDTDITQPTTWRSNIFILNGGILKITSEVKMAPGKSIVVLPGGKLEVNGGKITSCNSEKWGAIANRGTVELKDNATIENAIYGVITYNFTQPTTLTCKDAHFIDCTQGIGLINANTSLTVESSSFLRGDYGVFLNRSRIAPTFNNSFFSYQNKNGIHSISSEIDVQNNNRFTGCDIGISASNLFGNSTVSNIGIINNFSPNTFENNKKGIYTINSHVKISNNSFITNTFGIGIHYSGQNIFSSKKNTFDGEMYAEGMNGVGTSTCSSQNNVYNSDVGIFPNWQNSRYSFTDNCFTTEWWDVNVPVGSEISPAQGSLNLAASNCFTKSNVPDFICETANTIIYNVPASTLTAPDCMYPVKPGEGTPSGNYKTVEVFQYTNDGCGGANFNSPNEYQYIIKVGCDSTKIKKISDSLKVNILALKAMPQPLSDTDRWRLYFNERHLVYAMQQQAWCLRKQGKKRQLKELYTKWAAFFPEESYPRIKSAEVSYELGDTRLAQSELNALAIAMPAKQNAIAAIKLSMDVMTHINNQPLVESQYTSLTQPFSLSYDNYENGEQLIDGSQTPSITRSYPLTTSQYSLLVNVATSSDPDAAYGRALLGYLTGEYLEPYVDYLITPRSRKADVIQEKEVIKYMPNPTSDYLNLIIDRMDEKASYHYDMIDINGRIVLNGQLQADNQIDVSILINGVYILKTTKDDLPLERQKIIIQH